MLNAAQTYQFLPMPRTQFGPVFVGFRDVGLYDAQANARYILGRRERQPDQSAEPHAL